MDSATYFPLEVWKIIISNISAYSDLIQCALINKKLYNVANPKVWQALGEGLFFTQIIQKLLRILKETKRSKLMGWRPFPLGHNIRTLIVDMAENPRHLSKVVKFAPNLESLTLLTVSIRPRTLSKILARSTKLKLLRIQNGILLDQALSPLAQHRTINSIHLIDCRYFTPELFKILKDCPLTEIGITRCPGLLMAETAPHLNVFTNLESLVIAYRFDSGVNSRGDLVKEMVRLSDGGSFLSNLTFLELVGSNCTTYKDKLLKEDMVLSLIKTHPTLTEIALGCYTLTDATLEAMANHLPGLRIVTFESPTGLTAKNLRKLVVDCPQIHIVDFKKCTVPIEWFPEDGPSTGKKYWGHEILDIIRKNTSPDYEPIDPTIIQPLDPFASDYSALEYPDSSDE